MSHDHRCCLNYVTLLLNVIFIFVFIYLRLPMLGKKGSYVVACLLMRHKDVFHYCGIGAWLERCSAIVVAATVCVCLAARKFAAQSTRIGLVLRLLGGWLRYFVSRGLVGPWVVGAKTVCILIAHKKCAPEGQK